MSDWNRYREDERYRGRFGRGSYDEPRGSDYDRDREEYAGARGHGFLGGDYGHAELERGFAGGYGYRDRDYDIERSDARSRDIERPSYRGRGPKNFQRSDERLRELVSERLEDHPAIDATDIEVSVSNAEVTLSGTVDDRRTKRLAEDIAESVPGVHDVHNSLKVDRNFFSRMADRVRDGVHRGSE